MSVQYRDIPGHPGYRAGSDGTIWSCWKRAGRADGRGNDFHMATDWKQLSLVPKGSGHLHVHLRGRVVRMVHGLVLRAFVGPPPPGMQACHFPDRNPANNRLENLRWDKPKANKADSIKHGTQARGTRIYNAKLDDAKAAEILRRHAAGESDAELVARFRVKPWVIKDVIRGRTWKHVPRPATTSEAA